jgi:ribosome maturation factor RimP
MLTPVEIKEKVMKIAQPIFDDAGMELIELTLRRQGRELMIQVLADRPEGGITLEECSFLNRKLVDAIDAQLVVPQEYSLELSSPGIDRPLTSRKDFLRVKHADIRVHLSGPIGGKREYSGILKDILENSVVVETQKYGEITIPIGNIMKAVQVF